MRRLMTKSSAKFGKWVSPITAERLAEKSVVLSYFLVDKSNPNDIYLNQMLPAEKGRYSIFKQGVNLLPGLDYNARTRVHEYGGVSFAADNNKLYFVNFADQNLYLHDDEKDNAPPRRITNTGVRFAELSITSQGLIAVAEEHKNNSNEVENYLALINPDTGLVNRLDFGVQASDFYAYPTVLESAGKIKLAWITWQHPNMPWNNTELWQCELVDGKPYNVEQIGNQASFQQPRWDPKTGDLVYLSDQSGYWNFYRLSGGSAKHIYPAKAEFGEALWTLGMRTWDFTANGSIVSQVKENGVTSLALLQDGKLCKFSKLPFCSFGYVTAVGQEDEVLFMGASPTEPTALIRFSPHGDGSKYKVVQQSSESTQEYKAYISQAEHITFPTTNGAEAHAYFYSPHNPNFTVAPGSPPPPLLMFLHGGPTSSCNNALKLPIQFWTSRGFAVVDVNYRGSTGYGRAFRESLERASASAPGNWGVMDVEDCTKCVEFLVQQDKVDASRVAIRGGSAGGFTTLACLANSSQVFKVGASYYGVSDLLALATDTHKFESRYLDRLIGELPQYKQEYINRSPISKLDSFSSPLLVLQGSEDKIVPPNQAELMVSALRERNLLVEYVLYEGEQHGFRKAETLVDSLNRELAFYLKVFYADDDDE